MKIFGFGEAVFGLCNVIAEVQRQLVRTLLRIPFSNPDRMFTNFVEYCRYFVGNVYEHSIAVHILLLRSPSLCQPDAGARLWQCIYHESLKSRQQTICSACGGGNVLILSTASLNGVVVVV